VRGEKQKEGSEGTGVPRRLSMGVAWGTLGEGDYISFYRLGSLGTEKLPQGHHSKWEDPHL
jgi:hypothetical protein